MFSAGMLSALAMAVNVTISSLALLVHSSRQLAVKLSGNKTPVLWRQIGWTTLALAGGVILAGGGDNDVDECGAGQGIEAVLVGCGLMSSP